MPRLAKSRRPAPPAVQPDEPLPTDEPPAAAAAVPGVPAMAAVLRVGEYEVGDGFCPRLCGYPDIRY